MGRKLSALHRELVEREREVARERAAARVWYVIPYRLDGRYEESDAIASYKRQHAAEARCTREDAGRNVLVVRSSDQVRSVAYEHVVALLATQDPLDGTVCQHPDMVPEAAGDEKRR